MHIIVMLPPKLKILYETLQLDAPFSPTPCILAYKYPLHTDGRGFDVHRKVSSSSVVPNDTRHGRIVQKEISSEQFAMV